MSRPHACEYCGTDVELTEYDDDSQGYAVQPLPKVWLCVYCQQSSAARSARFGFDDTLKAKDLIQMLHVLEQRIVAELTPPPEPEEPETMADPTDFWHVTMYKGIEGHEALAQRAFRREHEPLGDISGLEWFDLDHDDAREEARLLQLGVQPRAGYMTYVARFRIEV